MTCGACTVTNLLQSGNNAALKEWETQLEEKNQKKAAAELQAKKKKREEAKIALQKWYSDRKTALQVLYILHDCILLILIDVTVSLQSTN